ncbi:MAG: hypothetical protein JW892_09610 [Anaerolineae bacterium]|nr:hypothetical protein [Anaerolineae bacterium]
MAIPWPKRSFLLFLVLLIGLVACQSTSTPVVVPSVSPLDSPLTTVSVISTPVPPPTPAADRGVVVGTLTSDEPFALVGLILYLGDIIEADDETHVGFLDRSRAPLGQFDSTTGRFVFADVPPGIYSLIIYEVETTGRVYLEPSGDVYVIEVRAGETTDLGAVMLPAP